MNLLDNLPGVMAAAAVAPLIARRVPGSFLPTIVVEILLGVALGPFGLNWVTRDTVVDVVAQLGFAALILIAGIEVGARRGRDTGNRRYARAQARASAGRPHRRGVVPGFSGQRLHVRTTRQRGRRPIHVVSIKDVVGRIRTAH